MDNIVDKQKIDIFGQVGGKVPIRDIRDVIDFLNHLTNHLFKEGILPVEDIYLQSYEKFIESKGAVSGTIVIRTYNLEIPS